MPRLKKEVKRDYTIIHNAMIRDTNLGATERGLLITMLSLPESWDFSIRGLMHILPDGLTKISTALKNLEKAGYLIRRRIYENGKIADWEYVFSDEPMTEGTTSQDPGNQDAENLDSENLNQGIEDQGKQNIQSDDQENRDDNIINNNQINKNQILSDKKSIDQSVPDKQTDGYLQRFNAYIAVIRDNIEYTDYIDWIEGSKGYMTVRELDDIVSMITRAVCSDKPDELICGQRVPREVIRSTMLKVDRECLENAVERMKTADDIRIYEKYLISTLFNEVNSKALKDNNEERNAAYAFNRDFGKVTGKNRNL